MAGIFWECRVQLAEDGDKPWEERRDEAQAVLDQSLNSPTMWLPRRVPLRFGY
ncbi:hypothetical protein MW887_008212 [Aspergillus wentii]|nr:hypothetical protein MW887_008212 [Aspergillus wentii]